MRRVALVVVWCLIIPVVAFLVLFLVSVLFFDEARDSLEARRSTEPIDVNVLSVVDAGQCQVQVFEAYVDECSEPSGKTLVLFVHLLIKNVGTDEPVAYQSWRDAESVRLRDGSGRAYQMLPRSAINTPLRGGSAAIPPDHFVEDFLVFERPEGTVKRLVLDLPAANAGGEGTVRIGVAIP